MPKESLLDKLIEAERKLREVSLAEVSTELLHAELRTRDQSDMTFTERGGCPCVGTCNAQTKPCSDTTVNPGDECDPFTCDYIEYACRQKTCDEAGYRKAGICDQWYNCGIDGRG